MITSAYLVSLGACSDHVARFAAAFPDGLDLAACDVDATAAAVVAAGLDVGWAAEHILTPAGRAEYGWVRDTNLAAYVRAIAPALAEYERVCSNTARAEFERVTALAEAEYERVRDTALAEYQRHRATALITAAREHGITPTPQD